ncbi:MAG: PDZ domain-containing protein [Acidobacteriota bacterium]
MKRAMVVIPVLAMGLWARAAWAGPETQAVSTDAPTGAAAQEQAVREARLQAQELEKVAQERAGEAAQKAKELQTKSNELEREIRRIKIIARRPRLGIILNTDPDPKTDALGAVVQAVTPGGPAEKAGLKAGDVILQFNGTPLGGAYAEADPDESAPSAHLMALAGGIKDGDKVTLEFRRGTQVRTAAVVARSMDREQLFALSPQAIDEMKLQLRGLPERLAAYIPGSWLDLELADMNPQLGEYFGTSSGMLVLRAPKEPGLDLRGGDVILKIGNRAPASVGQAFRILRSYDPGDTVTMEILRKQKRMTLAVKVPKPSPGRFEWDGTSPEPPEPPDPPKVQAPAPRAGSPD